MTVNEELLAELSFRLSKLERENKRLKRAGATLLVIAMAACIAGAQRGIPEKIVAQTFELRSEDGKLLASMNSNPFNGTPSLEFFDPRPDGVIQASYSMSNLTFFGKVKNGTSPRLHFGLADNQGDLEFRDDQGIYRLHCGVTAQSQPFFLMRDSEKRDRISINLDNNEPSINLLDEERSIRAMLSTRADGTPSLNLFRMGGGTSMALGVGDNRPPGISILNQKTKSMIQFGINSEGQTEVKLLDEKGRSLQRP